MFVASGVGPFSGQCVHFTPRALEQLPYAIQRYRYEAERHYGILDARLADNEYRLGGVYPIADMAAWGWTRVMSFVLGEAAWDDKPHLKPHLRRWFDTINARPAATRAEALKDRHTFKTELDDEAKDFLFRHLSVPAA